jgi:hypothetical protein
VQRFTDGPSGTAGEADLQEPWEVPGGVLTEADVARIRLPPDELSEFARACPRRDRRPRSCTSKKAARRRSCDEFLDVSGWPAGADAAGGVGDFEGGAVDELRAPAGFVHDPMVCSA